MVGLLAAWFAGAPSAHAALRPAAPEPARTYVRLAGWARASSFDLRWLERDKILQLSNRWTKLVFEVNSCQAQVNGIDLRLSFPVALQNGEPLISQLDLGQTLGPILTPMPNPPGRKIKTICLDPGHGGKDPGERASGREEKTGTLLLAQAVRNQLQQAGFKVWMTRSSDTSVDLPTRTELARRRRADLFVSLHFNSSPVAANEVKGVETYCLTPATARSSNAAGEPGDTRWLAANRNNEQNLFLAYEIQKTLVKELAVEDRGVKRARFEVLREAAMPAVLIEGGFLSHPTEGRKIFDPAYRWRMARAITDGILAYKLAVKG